MKSDIGKIISEALNITFKNKWLWVFGMVVALFSGGGGGLSFPDLSGLGKDKDSEISKPSPYSPPRPTPGSPTDYLLDTPKVLGQSVVSFESVLASIPWYLYILVTSSILVLLVISWGISAYANSWATSSLINGVVENSGKDFASLSSLSKVGRAKAIEMLKLIIIPPLGAVLSFLIFLIPGALLFFIFPDTPWVIILLLLPVIAVFILIMVLVSISVTLGKVALITENLKWRDAFKRGFFVLKKHILDVFVLGIVNCFAAFVASIASCIAILVFGGVVALGLLGAYAFPPLLVVVLPIGVVVAISGFLLLGLAMAIKTVFSQSTWVLLYRQLTEVAVEKV